jgi:hypothetical protein
MLRSHHVRDCIPIDSARLFHGCAWESSGPTSAGIGGSRRSGLRTGGYFGSDRAHRETSGKRGRLRAPPLARPEPYSRSGFLRRNTRSSRVQSLCAALPTITSIFAFRRSKMRESEVSITEPFLPFSQGSSDDPADPAVSDENSMIRECSGTHRRRRSTWRSGNETKTAFEMLA